MTLSTIARRFSVRMKARRSSGSVTLNSPTPACSTSMIHALLYRPIVARISSAAVFRFSHSLTYKLKHFRRQVKLLTLPDSYQPLPGGNVRVGLLCAGRPDLPRRPDEAPVGEAKAQWIDSDGGSGAQGSVKPFV